MATLTPAEVNSVKRYLGYDLITADRWRGNAAAGLDRNIERLDDEAVTTVRGVLTELAGIDETIEKARGRRKASQVGNVSLNPTELSDLRKERKTVCAELARLLGVCPPDQAQGRVTV
jgi:hypothetical protein